MPLVSIPTGAIHVEDSGDGAPLLLIPGLGGVGAFWRAQMEAFASEFRVITFDHRGVGASAGANVAGSTAEMAQDVIQLMDALGLDRISVVGHSTGGAIAQHLALRVPERLERIVFSASWAGPSPLFLATFALRRRVLLELGVDDYLMLGTLLAHPAEQLQASFGGAETFLRARRNRFPPLEHELTRLTAVVEHDLRARLGEIGTPSLAICASDDQLTPPAFSREIARGVCGGHCEILPSGGHFCPQNNTEPYNAKVLAFLSAGRP